MSALYVMRYLGGTGNGAGAIYIGRGTIIGVDVGNARYHGSYTETAGRLRGGVTMTQETGGSLVTGLQVPAGTTIQISFDWPANFTTGPQALLVQGQPVNVSFEKIGDIP